MAQALVLYDGKKSVSAWNVDDMRGWVTLGGDSGLSGVDLYFARVPWLYRGAMDRAENVGSMPFSITQGTREIDGSAEYKNVLAFMPNPGKLLRQVELSLTMTGKAYLFKETNSSGYIKNLKYCNPNSISEKRDPVTGVLVGYERSVGSSTKLWPVSQFVAIHTTDYLTEDGAPKTSAAQAALTAAGVLYNADRFISSYFERGAIKATVLTVDGGQRDEAERLAAWWSDVVTGIKNAWSALVLRMQQVKATVIGEGLESLQNNELTTEHRQDISTALGVPESKLWSSAANYATRVEDERAYYKSTIIPECKTIADAFNEQVFVKEHKLDGYHLSFNTDTLEIFQENVAEQSQAASAFIDFLTKCPTAEIALQTALLMGFELDAEMVKAIEDWFTQKEEQAAQIQAQMEQQNQPPAPGEQPDDQDEDDAQPNPQEMRAILKTWERKAKHALKLGQSPCVPFVSEVIPLALQGAIAGQLEAARTEQDIKNIFASSWKVYP